MSYTGGYYLTHTDIIPTGQRHKHTAKDSASALSPESVDALNTVMMTPWRINTFISDTLQQAFVDGDTLNGVIPSWDPEPLPPRADAEVWDAMTKEQRNVHKQSISEVHGRNARAESIRSSFIRTMNVTERMRPMERHWYVWMFDFRTRMYSVCADLQPQGADLQRGLITFADGKRVGKEGLQWLLFRMATAFGEDKLPKDERVQWGYDHMERAFECADDPIANRWWTEADEPLSFLSTIHELTEAFRQGDPYEFYSHLPVNIDGSQNGLQHLSLMSRDSVGAYATNCSASPDRQDLYVEVLNDVKRQVSEDAVTGNELAHLWVGQLERKHVKRACMTTSYGVTERGIRDQLINDGFVRHIDVAKRGAAATYLQSKISKSLETTVERGKEIMSYFQEVASMLAEVDMPLVWENAIGSRITQAYNNMYRRNVKTLCGQFVLHNEDDDLGINKRKSSLSSAPNIVHSQDAAMCQLVINRMRDEHDVRHFHVIHDSYGVHPCFVSDLNRVTREVAYDMYKGNFLEDFHQYVSDYGGWLDLPEPPEQGDFDVAEVLRAPFFFS